MRDTDKILIENGIMPTHLTEEQHEQLTRNITQISLGEDGEVVSFAQGLQTQLEQTVQVLNDCLDGAFLLTKKISDTLTVPLRDSDGELTQFSDQAVARRKMTDDHIRMLDSFATLRQKVAQASFTLSELSRQQMSGPLSMTVATQLRLFYIALLEGNGHPALCHAYERLAQDFPRLSETLVGLYSRGLNCHNQLCEAIDKIATLTSDSVTAINKKQAPLGEYHKLLRSLLIYIHNLAEELRQIQKEANHVQIPDVL